MRKVKAVLAGLVVAMLVAVAAPASASAYLHVANAADHTCSLTYNAAAYDFWVTRRASWTGCSAYYSVRYSDTQVAVGIRHTSTSSRRCDRVDMVYGHDGGMWSSRIYPSAGSGLSLDCYW